MGLNLNISNSVTSFLNSVGDNLSAFGRESKAVAEDAVKIAGKGLNIAKNAIITTATSIGDSMEKIMQSSGIADGWNNFINYNAEIVGNVIDNIPALWELYKEGIREIPGTAIDIWDSWVDFWSNYYDKSYWNYLMEKDYKKTTITFDDSDLLFTVETYNGNIINDIERAINTKVLPYKSKHRILYSYLLKYKWKFYNDFSYLSMQEKYEKLIYDVINGHYSENTFSTNLYKKLFRKLFLNYDAENDSYFLLNPNSLSNSRSISIQMPLVSFNSTKVYLFGDEDDDLFLATMNDVLGKKVSLNNYRPILNLKMFYDLLENELYKDIANSLKEYNKKNKDKLLDEVIGENIPEFNVGLQEFIKTQNINSTGNTPNYEKIEILGNLLNEIINAKSYNYMDLSNYLNSDVIYTVMKNSTNKNFDSLNGIKWNEFCYLFDDTENVSNGLINIYKDAEKFRELMNSLYTEVKTNYSNYFECINIEEE